MIRPAQLLDAIRAIDDDTDLRGFKLETDEGLGSWTRYDDLLKSPDRQSIAIQTVNYNATDQQLKDAFAKQIPIYRKHLGITAPTKKVTDNKIQDLKTSPVIPFIDLMLWAGLYDCEITDSVYASVLYPDGRYDGDKIRLSIRPSAVAVLEPQFMGALNELAVQERESERENV